MKRKNLICGALAAAMMLGLAGCGAKTGSGGLGEIGRDTIADPAPAASHVSAQDDGAEPGGQPGHTVPIVEDEPDPCPEPMDPPGPVIVDIDTDVNPHWFEEELQRFLENKAGYGGTSYMVSPASYRTAMCLAIEGSEGTTHDMLLFAAGFRDDDDMLAWYNSLADRQMRFMERYDALKAESELYGDGSDPDMGFDIANAVWDNTGFPGGFTDGYADAIMKKYGATASKSSPESITSDVNGWCSEKTHGMIRSISNDLSKSSSVLANALYIKSGWLDEFSEYMTEKGYFTKLDGTVFETELMRQTDEFLYCDDGAGKRYAVFGLEGDIWLTVCLGTGARAQDFFYGMYNAERTLLDVKMPKLDMETSFDSGEFTDFLDHMDAGIALGDTADFSGMTDSAAGWHIDDIVQKTRIKTDEKGMEAAAVTMIAMVDNCAIMDEPQVPIEFYMDEPFSFMITAGRNTSDSDAEILFFGQYAG